VWINIREQAWPEIPAIENADWELLLDDDRDVNHPFFYWFYARTYILTPDGQGVYNLDSGLTRRYQPEADLYLTMLEHSLSKHNASDARDNAPFWAYWRL